MEGIRDARAAKVLVLGSSSRADRCPLAPLLVCGLLPDISQQEASMPNPIAPDQPQKSEVHETTDDASTSPANPVNTTKTDPDRNTPDAGTALPEKSFE